jgi:hypothetical protein
MKRLLAFPDPVNETTARVVAGAGVVLATVEVTLATRRYDAR